MSSQDSNQTYEGWSNYATWGVALVLDNDEGTYTFVRERLSEMRDEADEDRRTDGGSELRYDFAKFLEDYTEELCGLEDDEDHLSLMARQVISAGLAEVNWDEIATTVLSES